MNTKSIIEIFRGDDSDALGYQTIVGTIHTDLDLTDCKAVFRYLGFFQEFDPIPKDGKLTIVIPSASSMQFPPGFGYASLKVYDIDRKVRTFTNRIPVFVKTMTPCRGGGEFDVEFSPFPELEPLKIFVGPNADDFDQYTGFISKIIDRASAQKYGLSALFDAMDAEKTAEGGCAASPAAVKAAYDAIIKELTDNYYTAEQTDEAIDKLAAYYITSDTQGNPFATHAALVNATTYYSGGSVRTPTRNDYAIVVADETHNNEEWRYIYSENEQGVGQWEPQYAVEGVITFDDTVTRTSANGVKSSGIWSALWGALSALPSGVSSIYDWIVSQLSLKADKTYVDAKSSIKSPDGDTVVSADNDGTAKVTKTTHTLGNPTVTFPALYNIRYYDISWGSEYGITMEFVGPVPSSVPYAPNDEFYYYSVLGTFDSYDPSQYDAWCIWVSGGRKHLMYKTGPFYDIDDFDSASPSLTLNQGEVMGEPPVMTRTDNSSSTTKTVATTDQIPAVPTPYTSSPNMDGSASAGSSSKFSRGDHRHPSDTSRVPTTRTVNGKALSSNVTLTGADIPVDSTQGAPQINTALAGKLVNNQTTPDGTATLSFIAVNDEPRLRMTGAAGEYIDITFSALRFQIPAFQEFVLSLPMASGLLALTSDLNAKLDSTSAAPAFSSDSSTQYAVGSHVTYNGKLYVCTTATTGGTWVTGSWTADTMTDPDAVLDITSQNQLRVVAKDGTLLWAQGYDLASTSSATLACDACNNFTFANGATSQAFTLPTAPTGKVGDFGLDIDNSANTSAATMTLTGLDTTFSVVVPEGESLNDMLAIAAGELARFYITLSTFRVNNLPTWHIVKQVVENGGATA